ncbi:MAG: hypothetical protein F4W95_10305 [Chloroflexi bacterium]|nr:hypothetical protein [Chloroflexota bacterium]MYD48864.1 hypothetical protein [Chloroflexota bacterium]
MGDNGDNSRIGWRFFDGSIAISASMLFAVLLRACVSCNVLPVLGHLHRMTVWDNGVIIVATLLLFPSAALMYGGMKLYFAAREAVRKEFREKGRQEGLAEGRKAERERIQRLLAQRGVPLTSELAEILAGESEES